MKNYFIILLFSLFSSCTEQLEIGPDFLGRKETCTNVDIDFEKIGLRQSLQGFDYDIIAAYKIFQSDHRIFMNFISSKNDTLSNCGYWILNDTHAIYLDDQSSIKSGHFFKMEYSYDLNILLVREINI